MPFVVEKDKPLDPVNVRFLGPVAGMPRPNRLPHLLQQTLASESLKMLER